MNKVKVVVRIVLGILASFVLCLLALLSIAKFSVLSKDYVKSELAKNGYYDNVYNEILEKMENYMVSSGLPNEILNEIFTKEDVVVEVNKYIDNAYNGGNVEVSLENVETRLNENIDNYLTAHKIEVTDKDILKSFVDNMVDIYKNEISLYDSLNGVVKYIPSIVSILDNLFIILIVAFVVLLITLLLLKTSYIGSVFAGAGLFIIFFKALVFSKVDYENILIISNNFSTAIKGLVSNFGNTMIIVSVVLIVIGIILSVIQSFVKADKKAS